MTDDLTHLDLPDRLTPPMEESLPGIRRDVKLRMFQALYLLATTGYALSQELRASLEICLGLQPGNGSVQRIFARNLPVAGLVNSTTLSFIGRSDQTAIRLSATGERLCRSIGWPVTPSEWGRMIAQHAGNQYRRHTIGVLAFCHQARLRHWDVTLLPQPQGGVEPDVQVSDELGLTIQVEFEVRAHHRLEKWQKAHRQFGRVAIATFLPRQRANLVRECIQARVPVLATDLKTLIEHNKTGQHGPLWLEEWGSPYPANPPVHIGQVYRGEAKS